MINEIFLAVRDGRLPSYDLLPLGAGGTRVSATAARIATHAYAMPPATQPAVTRASPILFGCRVLDGQVHSAEDLHAGGLRAGRVAVKRSVSLSLAEPSLFDYEEIPRPAHILRTSILCSLAWHAAHEHARDRAGSSGPGPILAHGEDTQHV